MALQHCTLKLKPLSSKNKLTKEMNSSPPPSATGEHGGDDGLPALPPEVIESHILTRLDGPTLASAAACSATFRHLSSQSNLWSHICHSTWPSTASPRINHVITTFPGGGPRAFFSHAFPHSEHRTLATHHSHSLPAPLPAELLSAVDIHYRNKLILTKIHETETISGWFRCAPFRIDLLEPKDDVSTHIKNPEGDETCTEIGNEVSLSWILIDPIGRRAMNLSSHRPVTVQSHWLTKEVQVHFASILAVDYGHVHCGIVVTFGGLEGGGMQVTEVSLKMEDMDGIHLNGKDSLVILNEKLRGKKGTGSYRVQEGKRRYNEYLVIKRERREKKMRRERALDIFCVAFGVFIFYGFWCFILCRLLK